MKAVEPNEDESQGGFMKDKNSKSPAGKQPLGAPDSGQSNWNQQNQGPDAGKVSGTNRDREVGGSGYRDTDASIGSGSEAGTEQDIGSEDSDSEAGSRDDKAEELDSDDFFRRDRAPLSKDSTMPKKGSSSADTVEEDEE